MMIPTLVAGLVLLLVGAELLVRGASRLAAAFAIPPLVVGLTVVAFGTSAPELAVSVGAALSGRAEIALGNVLGSNIFNVLFILGLSALIAPLAVSLRLVRLEVPILIGVSSLVAVVAWNGSIGRTEGGLLVILGLGYTVFQVREARRGNPSPGPAPSGSRAPSADLSRVGWKSVGWVVLGLALLALGSHWLVEGAIALARLLAIDELLIGLTIVAAGTSLPEVATSVMASLRGERDLAVGNVIGSNIFNILWVLGLASLLSDQGVRVSPEALAFDVPVMLGVTVACLPIFFTGFVIARWEGGLFLSYYCAYTLLLGMAATQAPGLTAFRIAILGFVAPLTLLTLGILALRAGRERSSDTNKGRSAGS